MTFPDESCSKVIHSFFDQGGNQQQTRFTRLGLLVLTLTFAGVVAADSAIYRCTGEDDTPVFSDRSCSALGIVDRKRAREVPEAFDSPSLRLDCSRRVDILEAWVRAALDSGDVNQLAGLYHWMDVSPETADVLMSELGEISSNRLVLLEVESLEFEGREYPARLWLTQYHPAYPGRTIRTGFSLVMNSGCWWLHR